MWISFWLAFILATAVLYIPGFLMLGPLGVKREYALCLAPLATAALVMVAGEALAAAKIALSPTVFATVLAFAGLVVYMASAGKNRSDARKRQAQSCPIKAGVMVAYVAFGLLAAIVAYISVAGTPENFIGVFDMVHHSNAVRSFLNTGTYTSFRQGSYMSGADQAISPWPGLTFYPSVYHVLVAMVMELSRVSLPVAINATNLVFASVVFPLGLYALLSRIFVHKPCIARYAAPFAATFSIFPWGYLVYGPLYPNMAGFALMPILAAVFIELCARDLKLSRRAVYLVYFLWMALGLAFIHPNTIFALAIFLMPFLMELIWRTDFKGSHGRALGLKLAWSVALLAAWVGFFYLASKTSAVQTVATYDWGVTAKPHEALKNILRAAYVGNFFVDPPQWILAVLILIGAGYVIYDREYLWTLASYVLMAYATYVNATQSGAWKHFIGGFWYTDPYRFGAMCCIFAFPLIAAGAYTLYRLIMGKAAFTPKVKAPVGRKVALVLVGALMLWVSYSPLPGALAGVIPYPLGAIRQRIGHDFTMNEPYSQQERAFVDKIMAKIGPDTLVLNIPSDGSLFAYSINNMRTYWRPLNGYGDGSESSDSMYLRFYLDRLSYDQRVQKIVKQIGAKYVLVLEGKGGANIGPNDQYGDFAGLAGITKSTPGFKLVAQDHNMRLFEIDPSYTK